MAKCKDCIHCEACLIHTDGVDIPGCGQFKDKSKFIELPCSIGDYCIYQDDLWYVNNITYCCDGSFLLWISMADKSPCGAEVPLSEVKFISEEDARNWRQ